MSDPDTPQATGPTERLLECGRDPVDVIDRARAGQSTAHERSCPFCEARIAADGIAGTAAAELALAEGRDVVPTTLLPNVMRSVWSDLRRSTMIPLSTDSGSAFVSDHAVAAVIEHELDGLAELQIHTCAARLAGPDTVAIDLTAGAAYDTDVRGAAARARDLVRRTVEDQFGWTAEPIDIDIVDIYLPEGRQR